MGGRGKLKTRRKSFKFKQPKIYTPTLHAATGGIKATSKKKKLFTGIEQRGIL